jgi:hypothetical protein
MKRIPASAIDFSDTRSSITGFARDWFFWVHQSFKPALDIAYSEVIDPVKTKTLRDSEARRRGFESLDDMQAKIRATGEALGDSETNAAVMKYAVRKPLESQGQPPIYRFRATDGFESRCGKWYVQISQATPDKIGDDEAESAEGSVGLNLYEANVSTDSSSWVARGWHVISQGELVALLKTGKSGSIDLRLVTEEAPRRTDPAQSNLFAT